MAAPPDNGTPHSLLDTSTTPSYSFSYMSADGFDTSRHSVRDSARGSVLPRSSDSVRSSEVFVRGSLLDRDIEAVALSPSAKPERRKDYKGRHRIWPGVLLFVLLSAGACVLMTHYAMNKHQTTQARAAA